MEGSLLIRFPSQVGNLSSEKPADIRLSGSNILPEHCYFESTADGKVVLHAMPHSTTMVNGLRITSTTVGISCFPR